jgi:hypothetical protein
MSKPHWHFAKVSRPIGQEPNLPTVNRSRCLPNRSGAIVRQFKLGETAEQLQHSFPSLSLREIYGAIYYYLENTDAVEDYLRRQEQAAEEGERFIESHFDTADLRAKILARRRLTPGSFLRGL